MTKSAGLRIALNTDGISIWSSEIFDSPEPSRLRDFLSRAFAVQEIEGVELRRATAFGRIRHGSNADRGRIWRKLSRALGALAGPGSPTDQREGPAAAVDVRSVFLDGPRSLPVRITRIGNVLSSWRVRHRGERTLRLWHPILRNRRDIAFRLEEELASVEGVEAFRANVLTARVSIRFDATTTAERLALELEKAWPRVLQGLDGPPSRKRLVAASALTGLAYSGQYLVPTLRPIAVAGVVLYGLPNVAKGAKELRQGHVGLSALYSTGLVYLLVSGLPFTAGLMSTLMQLWPQLSHRKIVSSQRRLFAEQRRRPTWARVVNAEGVEVATHVANVRKEDLVSVRRGERIPVDGIVEAGTASLLHAGPFVPDPLEERSIGDAVLAGARLRDGQLTIRVERSGEQTCASQVAAFLPHALLAGLPSSAEAERIANRNAKPTLALSVLALLLTRTLPPAQGLIRPDYATAPRISAQLSALQAIARGLQHGVLFKNPAALDRLAAADVYVIDQSAGFERPLLEVAAVEPASGVSADRVLGFVLAARRGLRAEQSQALSALAARQRAVPATARSLRRDAGVVRYQAPTGNVIEVASSRNGTEDASLQPLWVLEEGRRIGSVSFVRSADGAGHRVVSALRERNPHARIIFVSHAGRSKAHYLAQALRIEHHALADTSAQLELLRALGGHSVWIGDGSLAAARELVAASSVSISVAPLAHCREDAADILLPQMGLSGVPELLDISSAHSRRLARDFRTVYTANLLGASGALFASLAPLRVGLLSNVGTAVVYARHAWELERLASDAEKQRAELALRRA